VTWGAGFASAPYSTSTSLRAPGQPLSGACDWGVNQRWAWRSSPGEFPNHLLLIAVLSQPRVEMFALVWHWSAGPLHITPLKGPEEINPTSYSLSVSRDIGSRDPSQVSRFMDVQVPYIKWHNTCT
jgi:hypothetical protein